MEKTENDKLKKLVLSAMFLGLGLVLPFLTGQVRSIGNMLLPMHIPVLLCGFICGWQYGLLTGVVLPLMRSAIFSMPVMYPNAVGMAFELCAYGFFSGFLYSHSRKDIKAVYKSLIVSVLSGRVIWGIVRMLLIAPSGGGFTFSAFVSGAFLNAVPGIILQLVLIPLIMAALKKAKMTE